MYFDIWALPVDVEITREANGGIGATVSTDAEGIMLSDVSVFADYDKLFPEKKVRLGIGVGLRYPDKAVIMGAVEYKSYGVQYEYADAHTVLLTKSWSF